MKWGGWFNSLSNKVLSPAFARYLKTEFSLTSTEVRMIVVEILTNDLGVFISKIK